MMSGRKFPAFTELPYDDSEHPSSNGVLIDTDLCHVNSSFTLDSDQHVLSAGVSRRTLNEGESGRSMGSAWVAYHPIWIESTLRKSDVCEEEKAISFTSRDRNRKVELTSHPSTE